MQATARVVIARTCTARPPESDLSPRFYGLTQAHGRHRRTGLLTKRARCAKQSRNRARPNLAGLALLVRNSDPSTRALRAPLRRRFHTVLTANTEFGRMKGSTP